ncbi:MAG: hypothetical protein ACK5JD_03605 [Mangrovibacterium sp.]
MSKRFLFYLAGILLAVGCQRGAEDKTPVAKVAEHYLYLEDLRKIVPQNLHGPDSTVWVDDFVRRWVQNELLILNAEQNLSDDQKNVEREIEEYRNSLITYRYKKELMAQKMDTIVTESEITEYYHNNQSRYQLQTSILKALYLKIPLEVANAGQLRRYANDQDDQNMNQLNEYGLQYAKVFDRFGDKWVSSEQITQQIPDEINIDEQFLRRNKIIESSDTDYYYFICIRDFRNKGDYAPVEFVSEEIRNILLNERKIQFLKKIEADIYKEAVASKKFELFNQK